MTKRYYAGIDVGTSYIKTVILDETKGIAGSFIKKTGADLQKSISTTFQDSMQTAGISLDAIEQITATGFGRNKAYLADHSITEISAHARGAYHFFPYKSTIIDIGGQDTKIIKINQNGTLVRFRMNRKCAAGTGSFLEEIAYKLDIPLNELNTLAHKSTKEMALSSYCTVFAATEILSRIKEGEHIEDLVKCAFESIARRVIELDTVQGTVVITGGVVTYNDIIIKILERYIGKDILVPQNPQICGAIGAALTAMVPEHTD
ncbi:MAG: ATPase [Candidatus Thermoplasmatota archaeon]|nr:ATPase [Candidatus Thermoplasmatota archaeon]MBU1940431.1 ATPase [Candidatus Thermoplasmatota archaeon]